MGKKLKALTGQFKYNRKTRFEFRHSRENGNPVVHYWISGQIRNDEFQNGWADILNDGQLATRVKDSARQIGLAGLGAFAKAQEEGNKVVDALVKEGESVQAKTRKLTDFTENLMRHLVYGLFFMAGAALAGPNDVSKFDGSALGAQKVVYQFNFEKPEDLLQGLAYLNNHLNSLKEFGDVGKSHLVAVAHGNELHMLSRLNSAAYPDIYNKLKVLTERGVTLRVCRNAAGFRGYKPQDFYDLVTVVPAAMTEIAKWQGQGYAYISGDAIKRTKRDEFVAQHPEIMD